MIEINTLHFTLLYNILYPLFIINRRVPFLRLKKLATLEKTKSIPVKFFILL